MRDLSTNSLACEENERLRRFARVAASAAFALACGRSELPGLPLDSGGAPGEGGRGGAAAGNGGRSFAGGGGAPASGNGGAPISGSGGAPISGSGGAGQSGESGAGGMADVECGNGVLEPGEACEPGSEPPPPAFELRQGELKVPVRPVVGQNSAMAHFAYYSRSSHTGFEAPERSSLYLYRSSLESAVTLVVLNGVDDSSGRLQPPSDIVFDIQGIPEAAVLFSDDDVEFARTTSTTARAEWDCTSNTDGGMIQDLPVPGAWHLTITPAFFAGITEWAFLSGTEGTDLGAGEAMSLDLSLPVEIVALDLASGCREDCSLPRCGDTVLDPGEVCDDGNEQTGDGCFGCQPES
jgi:cysteine-rich repeat protein